MVTTVKLSGKRIDSLNSVLANFTRLGNFKGLCWLALTGIVKIKFLGIWKLYPCGRKSN
jgi:hypothetical protein